MIRVAIRSGLIALMIVGFLALPVGFVMSVEDGPMPADELHRKKARATTVVIGGGVAAALAACGLYATGRRGICERRGKSAAPGGVADGRPKSAAPLV